MNVKTLRAMRRCCDDQAHFSTMRPILYPREVFCTDRFSMVRYSEDHWVRGTVRFPETPVALPDDALDGLEPSQEIGVSDKGFVLPDGSAVFRDGINAPKNINDLWEGLRDDRKRHGKPSDCYDPALLKRVLGVFEAAGCDPNVVTHLCCIEIEGWRRKGGVWIRAIVMGKVR